MSEPIDTLWKAHNKLQGEVSNLSKQQEIDRMTFERQLASIEHRQTDILAQVSSSYQRMETSFKEQSESLIDKVGALESRLTDQEKQKARNSGYEDGLKAERKKNLGLFGLILTGILAVAGWILTRS